MAAAAMPSPARAEPPCPSNSLSGRIVGTWSFASSLNTKKDGSTFDRWGTSPRGIFMFDRGGNYSQIIVGSESRVFGAKTFFTFGTYTLDEDKKHLVTRIEGCSVSKLTGNVQRREIVSLTADELKYWNPVTSTGATAEVVWKRVT
jgi:hypothetical protein